MRRCARMNDESSCLPTGRAGGSSAKDKSRAASFPNPRKWMLRGFFTQRTGRPRSQFALFLGLRAFFKYDFAIHHRQRTTRLQNLGFGNRHDVR